MLRSQRSAEFPPAKRRPKLPRVLRPRKKQKRLDAIRDEPTASFLAHRDPSGDDASNPRRSSRTRRAPVVLDSSPVPSTSRKKHTDPDPPGVSARKKIKWKEGKELAGGIDSEEKKKTVWQTGSLVGADGEWRSRLRSWVGKGRGKSSSSFQESGRVLRNGRELLKPVTGEEDIGPVSSVSRSCRSRKKVSTLKVSEVADEAGNQDNILPVAEKDENNGPFAVKDSQVDEVGVASDTQASLHQAKVLESPDKIVRIVEQAVCDDASVQNKGLYDRVIERIVGPSHLQEMENHSAEVYESVRSGKHFECIGRNGVERVDAFKGNAQEAEIRLKDDEQRVPMMDAKTPSFRIKEGRRCGLCGCGSDGKPPKRLVRESLDSENEAFEGSSASEEPNYDVWDGFGDEPGWQGKLLGPIHDRFGIPRVWVHQNCAVWSPEVYFTGLRCLKNVRAALCRGRALKCSRCGRPGATIGCRVDRCPKTYHLPCSRVEGCIFDHRKFLIACSDHKKFFQPLGNKYFLLIKKMKAKKMRLDFRKISNEARRKDLDAEEKWLENCGEDEEFLKREGRRLHRDILRITPTYIGGSSDNEKLYQGWESVAGLEHVIQCMKEVVILPLLYPEFFANLGLVPPRGVLLHGYPGTGKTHVVRALIGACSRGDKQIAYFARKGADCLGKYVGDAERQLRLLFQVAERSQPSIIFFDEIDGLAPCRSKQQDQTHSSVVSTLLSLLDGLKSRGSVIVIGATNRPDAVDPALRRPGRFDREIYFPLPSLKDRSAILSLHTRSWPRPLSGSLLSWVANQTVGYAGADLQALCTHAVMHALKRKCALQQLLSYAEKGNIQGKLPCLPSFEVKERDWLAALAMAPPPCSRREAGIAANDVIASPLPVHLVPCLLLPLAHLLVSLYVDERIWLPPSLFEASKSIEEVIVSALEKKGVAMAFWWSCLNHLIEDPFIAGKIEKHFAHYGLIIGSEGFNYPFIWDEGSDVPRGNQKFESLKRKSSSIHMHREFMQKCPLSGNSLGFRTLISGAPRSGQQHLASCLLQGFLGHVEIRKINLATISQEGHGDMIHGLSQILLKCLDVARCVIYMPRVDLWAIEETTVPIANVSQVTPKESKSSMAEKVHSGRKSASELWNSFAEHVHSACTAASLTILATCEVEHTDLPHGVRRFFSSGTCGHADSTPAESTIPRFSVHLNGKFNHDLVINSAAVKLSYDLVQHYLMLMHGRAHLRYSEDIHVSNFENIYSEAHKKNFHSAAVSEDQSQNAMARSTIVTKSKSLDLDRIASNDGSSCRNDQKLQGTKNRAVPQTTGGHYTRSRPYGFQGSFPRTGKVVKGNLVYAIETFGYQILRYPQLAELCWVTSKLNEGPCTDITGPWKGWPFNSCVMHTECSHDKVVSGANSGNVHDIESPGVVRGLIAVGLLAYRGYYASVREVSADVRKVLELLVGHIRAKIFDRKDRYRYFRILSQVAYLDDMVNSWAYMLQSLQVDSTLSEAISKTRVVGRLEADDTNTENIIADNPSNFQHLESRNIVSEISQDGFVISNGECSNTTGKKVVEHSGAKGSLLSKGSNTVNQSPGLAVTGKIHNFEANRCNQDSVTLVSKPSEKGARGQCNDGILPSYHAGCIPARHGDDANFSLLENGNISNISCLYNCCSKCTHMLNILARKTISSYLKLNGSCSNMDDIHDIIVSCSLNLFNTFKKCWISDTPKIDGHFWRKVQCYTQPKEKDDCLESISCHCKTTEKMDLLLTECLCHTRMEVSRSITDTGDNSLFETTFKYFFRDGVLAPLVSDKDPEFHCNFEKLCICSVVMMLLKIKQALDG